jgi:predicted nucleic acid-binding protein
LYVVDASVWASYFISVDKWHNLSRDWLRTVIDEEALIIAPTLLLPEVAAAISRRTGRADLATRALSGMGSLRRLELLTVDLDAARSSAQLAGDLRLAGADAVYAWTAHELAVSLVTWDKQLRDRAGSVVNSVSPEDLLAPS